MPAQRIGAQKMKKTIVTKQIKLWQLIDRLAFIIPPLVFLILSVQKSGRLLWSVAIDAGDAKVTASAVIIVGLSTLITCIPILLIWRAVSHTAKKAALRNATFHTIEDFDYYREKLAGIPPVTISLLMDLRIETKKDVAALLLKYVQMGAVSMEGGTVNVLSREHPGLLPSDRTLLDLIAQGKVQAENLGLWKKQATDEAIQSGNLKRRGAQQGANSAGRTCLTGCLSGCLLPILLLAGMFIGAALIVRSDRMAAMERFLSAAPDTFADQAQYLFSSPDMVMTSALMFLIILPLFIVMWLPIAALVRVILSFSNDFNSLKRTEEGELLTAQISGMKNFIRDFSNLSQADKEQLILWDDFLIYAVVLEENERITADIFSMKNMRYRDFILF